jgi:hypothetical protein
LKEKEIQKSGYKKPLFFFTRICTMKKLFVIIFLLVSSNVFGSVRNEQKLLVTRERNNFSFLSRLNEHYERERAAGDIFFCCKYFVKFLKKSVKTGTRLSRSLLGKQAVFFRY